MGLDLVLGGLVLIAAIRGWFKGFVLQAVRLVGLIACVYLADPVLAQVRPHVISYLPKAPADLMERLLWWASAAASYVVLAGLATLAVKLYRRQPVGLAEPNRGDQFAGLLLGAAKGALVVAFLASGVQKHALETLKKFPRVEEQSRTSQVLKWDEKYRPAETIWTSPPVRHFVGRVRQRGFFNPSVLLDSRPVETASGRTPRLSLPADDSTSEDSIPPLDPELARALEERKGQIQGQAQPE